MQYDTSPEPENLSGFTDHALQLMLPAAKGLERAALNEVLALRRERIFLIREVEDMTKRMLDIRNTTYPPEK